MCVEDVIAAAGNGPALVDDLAGAGDIWPLLRSLFAYTPERALRNIRIPTLCMYGSRYRVVPVGPCVNELERLGNPSLDVAVLAGGDHRFQRVSGDFAVGYFGTLTGFLTEATRPVS